jgi:hypothetical protein
LEAGAAMVVLASNCMAFALSLLRVVEETAEPETAGEIEALDMMRIPFRFSLFTLESK